MSQLSSNVIGGVVTVATAVVGIAILATLVSKNAQTPAVVSSFGKAFSDSIRAATGPVTGGGFSPFSL